jgi:phage/plasmid-associated DNA primase
VQVADKELTAGDPVSARFMRQDFFEFRPTFKLVIAGNAKPVCDASTKRAKLAGGSSRD